MFWWCRAKWRLVKYDSWWQATVTIIEMLTLPYLKALLILLAPKLKSPPVLLFVISLSQMLQSDPEQTYREIVPIWTGDDNEDGDDLCSSWGEREVKVWEIQGGTTKTRSEPILHQGPHLTLWKNIYLPEESWTRGTGTWWEFESKKFFKVQVAKLNAELGRIMMQWSFAVLRPPCSVQGHSRRWDAEAVMWEGGPSASDTQKGKSTWTFVTGAMWPALGESCLNRKAVADSEGGAGHRGRWMWVGVPGPNRLMRTENTYLGAVAMEGAWDTWEQEVSRCWYIPTLEAMVKCYTCVRMWHCLGRPITLQCMWSVYVKSVGAYLSHTHPSRTSPSLLLPHFHTLKRFCLHSLPGRDLQLPNLIFPPPRDLLGLPPGPEPTGHHQGSNTQSDSEGKEWLNSQNICRFVRKYCDYPWEWTWEC